MNLHQLRYFTTLAQEEHYTKAALKLHITQPSLTHAIHLLEDELDVALFEKKGRNVVLTKYGKLFLKELEDSWNELNNVVNHIRERQPEIEPILNRLDNSIENIKQISKGKETLNIGFVRRLGMSYIPQLISSFQNENVTFQCHSGFSYELIHDLKKNDLDIVFCSYVDDQEIYFKPIITQEFYVIVSLNHPLAKNDEIDLKQIEDLPFITFTKNSGIRPMIDHLLEKSKIHPHISMELEEDEVVGGFVGHDLGVAIVPDMAVYDLLPIKKIKIKDIDEKQTFYMAYLKNTQKSKAFLEFIEHVNCDVL